MGKKDETPEQRAARKAKGASNDDADALFIRVPAGTTNTTRTLGTRRATTREETTRARDD